MQYNLSPPTEKFFRELTWPLVMAAPLFTFYPLLNDNFDFYASTTGSRALVCLLELLFICTVFLNQRRLGFAAPTGWLPASALAAFSVWVVSSSIATALAAFPYPALLRQTEWYCHLLFAFSFCKFISLHPYSRKYFFWLIPIGFLLAASLLILKWHAVPDPLSITWASNIPGFQNIRHFGYYLVITFIFSFYFLLSGNQKDSGMAITAVLLTACWTLLFWTGGRGAFVAILLSSVMVFLLFDFLPKLRIFLLSAGSGILGFIISSFYRIPGTDLVTRLTTGGDGITINYSSAGRIDIWKQTIEAYSNRIFFGFGPDGYAYLHPPPHHQLIQPHNILLQFFTDWGLFGGISALFLLVILSRRIFTKILKEADQNRKSARLLAFWGILAFLALAMIDGTLYHAFSLFFLMFAFAIGLEGPRENPVIPFALPFKILLGTVFSAILIIISLHSFVIVALHSPSAPPPSSHKARLIRKFPTSLTHLEKWLLEWQDSDYEETLEWTRWAQQYARKTWKFYLLEAKMMQAQHHYQDAQILLRKSMEASPRETARYLLADPPLANLWRESTSL